MGSAAAIIPQINPHLMKGEQNKFLLKAIKTLSFYVGDNIPCAGL
jgi:hypothetical protein